MIGTDQYMMPTEFGLSVTWRILGTVLVVGRFESSYYTTTTQCHLRRSRRPVRVDA